MRICQYDEHVHGDTNHSPSRHFSFKKRSEFKENCLHKSPQDAYFTLVNKGVGNLLNTWDASEVKSLPIIQKMKSEKKAEARLDPNIIKDIILRINIAKEEDITSSKCKGIIPFFCVEPMVMGIFTEEMLLATPCNGIFQFDATGGVVQKITPDRPEIFYYSLVMPNPKKGQSIINLGDWLSESKSEETIQMFLGNYKSNYSKCRKMELQPLRVSVDYSWAMLYATIHTFNPDSRTLQLYLERCYRIVTKQERNADYNRFCQVYMCYAHISKNICNKLTKLATPKVKQFYKQAFHLLHNATNLQSFSKIFENLCYVALSKTKNSKVDAAVAFLSSDNNYSEEYFF